MSDDTKETLKSLINVLSPLILTVALMLLAYAAYEHSASMRERSQQEHELRMFKLGARPRCRP